MKIVIAHNFYHAAVPSGENRMVKQIGTVLEEAGAEVIRFERFSDDIERMPVLRKLEAMASPVYSRESARLFRELIATTQPDVLQLHNPFPLISPVIVRVAHAAGLRIVNFVHNYRHICMAGTLIRDGSDCRLCPTSGSNLSGVRFGCYRGSRPQSAVMAASAAVHRGTWRLVDRFVAVSEFVRQRLIEGGVDPGKISVRHNTVADPGWVPSSSSRSFLFASRLDSQKGVDILLDAWRLSHLGQSCSLEIAGSGPLESVVRRAAASDQGIKFLGQLSGDELRCAYERAAAVVVPSTCHDACPLTVIEALAYGRPVVGTNMGGIPELIDGSVGWICSADSKGLADGLVKATSEGEGLAIYGSQARRRYEERFEPKATSASLLALHSGLP